jgi:predicted molibdopterin-dependent oxidoreductase YjgC
VRALAERAERVLVTSMFHGLAAGWADLVLPGTSYLEREGTTINLEGRLQRQRRTASPPAPDELEWISQLAARFGVTVSPYASSVFEELSQRCYAGLPFGEVGERAPLRGYEGAPAHVEETPLPEAEVEVEGLRLVAYRPLFSGPAVERVTELQFQRPRAEVTLNRADAEREGIRTGDLVTLSQNGTSLELRAKLSSHARPNVALVAIEHSNGLSGSVHLTISTPKEAKS